jgi:hypothetical protein
MRRGGRVGWAFHRLSATPTSSRRHRIPDHPLKGIDFFLNGLRKGKMNRSTKANTPIKLKRLVLSSVLYLIWASIGAVVAIVLNLPARFGGSTSGLPVVQGFIYGMGTALGPPLLWWMVPQAFLTWLAWNQMNRRSIWGVIGLPLFGAATFGGALGEPITYELLNPVTFNPLLAVIQAGLIIIPFVMMVFAVQEWRRRRSETKQKENRLIGDLRE